jgi:hypothetical protein
MRKHKFLKSAILTGAICLLTVMAFSTEKADAWGWYGFSDLCVDSTLRGPGGHTVTFTLQNVTVYTQCYNENAENFGQPGIGNLGYQELVLTTESVGSGKLKGIVSVNGCIDLSIFDNHYYVPPEEHPEWEHIHTCHPLDNVNKVEQIDSAWISDFTVTWEWRDDKGRLVNDGTDVCHTWLGEIDEDGYPTEGAFLCDSTSTKKINWILEDNWVPPEE